MKKKILIILAVIACIIAAFVGYSAYEVHQSAQEFQEAYESKKSFERTETDEAEVEADGEKKAEEQSGDRPYGVIEPGSEYEVDTYIDNRDNSNRLYIYDMDYMDLALDFKPKKLADFIDVINENSKIARKFKPILTEYCTRVFDKYPDIELRPFYRNLKDLEVIECTDQELMKVTWDTNSCGCYVRDEDKIYVLKDKEYEEGTWDYQVLYHEFSHCLRDSIYEDEDGNRVSIQLMGLNY